ncbi:MAG: hypothetical protein KDC88_08445, partial [Ignavibacteriae bacterium]|nr:hypothetical protein [Ignavibacteriota bacterium]
YDYLKNKIEEVETPFSEKQIAYFNKFVDNLNEGIGYYKNLFEDVKHKFEDVREDFLVELENIEFELANLIKPVQLVKVS